MALSQLEQDTIDKGIQAAKRFVAELKPILDQLNVIYDGANGVKTTVAQPGLNEVAALSGLTKAQLDDGFYALTATLKGAIDSTYTQLMQLAARG